MGIKTLVDSRTRKLALLIIVALFVGNGLAETGDAAMLLFRFPAESEHIILAFWLAVGLGYLYCTYLSLVRRRGIYATRKVGTL